VAENPLDSRKRREGRGGCGKLAKIERKFFIGERSWDMVHGPCLLVKKQFRHCKQYWKSEKSF
jgi:hypothetical protein